MPLVSGSHISGSSNHFQNTLSSRVRLAQNTNLNNLFTTDSSFAFQPGEITNALESLVTKGTPDALTGSWSILNKNKYLWVGLVDQNGTNILAYKSNDQILNTRKRPSIVITWTNATKTLLVYVDSIPITMNLDTSIPAYHTNANNFTGLNVTTDDIYTAKGSNVVPYGEFNIYSDDCTQYVMGQTEINTYYQTIQDNRVLSPLGQILFTSDRIGGGFGCYTANEDGTDPLPFDQIITDIPNGRWGKNTTDWTVSNQGATTNNPAIRYNRNGITSSYTPSPNAKVYTAVMDQSSDLMLYSIFNGSEYVGRLLNLTNLTEVTGFINSYSEFGFDCANTVGKATKVVIALDYIYAGSVAPLIYLYDSFTSAIVTLFSGRPDQTAGLIDTKFNKQDTKIGFSYMVNPGDTEYSVCEINYDGTGFHVVYPSARFGAYSPDGTKMLIHKKVNNKYQLHILDLVTNRVTNISNNNFNDFGSDWKA